MPSLLVGSMAGSITFVRVPPVRIALASDSPRHAYSHILYPSYEDPHWHIPKNVSALAVKSTRKRVCVHASFHTTVPLHRHFWHRVITNVLCIEKWCIYTATYTTLATGSLPFRSGSVFLCFFYPLHYWCLKPLKPLHFHSITTTFVTLLNEMWVNKEDLTVAQKCVARHFFNWIEGM